MLNILIYIENQEAQNLIVFNIEAALHVKFMAAKSVVECVSQIQKNKDIDIVICEGTEKTGSVVHYVAHNRVKNPTIVAVLNQGQKTGTFGVRNLLGVAAGDKILDEMSHYIQEYYKLKYTGQYDEKKPLPILKSADTPKAEGENAGAATTTSSKVNDEKEVSRISTTLLVRVSPLKAGVYIKLSATKFLRIFQEGDVFSKEDVEKYLQQKKVDYFYLKNAECAEFVAKLAGDLKSIIAVAGTDQKKAELLNEKIGPQVHQTVQDLVKNLGMTPELQQVVKNQVDLTVKALGKTPKLTKLMDRIKNRKDGYLLTHSTLLGELASAIAKAADWHTDTTFYKLCLAAFMHDITLSTDKLAMVQTMDELTARKTEFTENELKEYREHPLSSAELVRQMSDVPADVDIIIMQHHERPDGTGFPRKQVSAHISPLSACFIVAHDLFYFFLTKEQGTIEEFLQKNTNYYVGGNFKKVVKALEEMSGDGTKGKK